MISYKGMGLAIAASAVISIAADRWLQKKTDHDQTKGEAAIATVPEYRTTEAVILSEYLFNEKSYGSELARLILESKVKLLVLVNEAPTPKAVKEWLSANKIPSGSENDVTLINILHENYWVRDFSPFIGRLSLEKERGLPVFLDFMYKSENSIDDIVPNQLGIYLNTSVIKVPFNMDGGNMIRDDESCIFADSILPQETMKGDGLSSQLGSYFGCKKVYLIKDAPHIHVDMWAKFLKNRTLVVNELTEDSIRLCPGPERTEYALKIKKRLDEIAALFEKDGLNVIRIPMPLPDQRLFPTYANSLLLNKNAIVPSYKTNILTSVPYADASLFPKYEQKVRTAYENAGYKVRFLNVDPTINAGGAVHCVSAQIVRDEVGL
ncbi:MAG: agmatine deiminase family protein [Oligoflexales bacterium]|nr:agmatine deiminase family protein [Oligoflexales bacterium]